MAEMEFGLLGPLLVRRDGVLLPVPKGHQRTVLAALLLEANRAVPVEQIAEAVWRAGPPPSAVVTVRNLIRRLRQALGDAGKSRITAQPRGYLIRAGADELDLARFEALAGSAREAVRFGSWDEGAAQARAALALWRGEPLDGVESRTLAVREVPRLAEMRWQVLETRIDADLHLGQHRELVAELRRLVAIHPLREQVHALLMLALYRCGRQGEALAAYQHARTVLAEELGTDPGVGLRRLHQQILTADPAVAAPEPARSATAVRPGASLVTGGLEAGPGAAAVPRQLPGAVAGFTGRAAELAALNGLLDRPAGQVAQAVVISAIGGTAGVGKTALAVQWAHQVAGRFPGGQLYVNLRGYDPDRPVPAADALAGFLLSLGVPGQDILPEEDQRAAQYRSLLAGRKMLIVLDNAGWADQVRPLLPGTPGCVVVVTSRDSLAGLVTRHGATRLELDLLPPDEATGLLQALIGARVKDDPGAAATLAEQCCRLPLALRVAAELAAARPDGPLAGLVTELADQQRRLDLLDAGGDARTAVRAVLSWSYRHLDPVAARVFRLTGLHPGADFDVYAAAVLTGTGIELTRTVLDVLARAHLIQSAAPGRYSMHDLLRAYARELAGTRDAEEEQDAALTRLFDHYLHTASTAMDSLHPAETNRRPRIPPPDTPVPPVADPAAALKWLDDERAALVAVTVRAARHAWPTYATRLSNTLFRYLDSGGHYPEALTIHSHARVAAQREGDQAAEANALNCLAGVHWGQSRYQAAAEVLQQALALCRQLGDRFAQAFVLGNLGVIHHCQGRYREAIGFHRQALAIHRETGDRAGEANTLDNLGLSEERQGHYDLAARHHQQALAIAANIGASQTECGALLNLGTVCLRQARYSQAADHLARALAMARESGYRGAEAEVLARTGDLRLRQGQAVMAARHLTEALALYRELGSRSGEADALNSLGEVLIATSQPDHAQAEHDAALGLAAQVGDKYQQARAQHGLGQACHASGNPGEARRKWQQALDLFTELGTPEAGLVRAHLAAAHDGQPQETAGLPVE